MTLFRSVKSKRRFVQPNNGFIVQLRLFHKMNWKIDSHHEKYKLYRLRMAADKVRKGKHFRRGNCLPTCKQKIHKIETDFLTKIV